MATVHKVIALDTETGGLDPRVHSLLEVGVVEVLPGLRAGRQFTVSVVEPQMVVTPEAMRVNGIDLRGWRGLLPEHAAAAIVAQLRSWWGRPEAPFQAIGVAAEPERVAVTVVGWNVDFDVDFLRRLPVDAVLAPWRIDHRKVDVASIFNGPRIAGDDPKPVGMGQAMSELGISEDDIRAECAGIGFTPTRDLMHEAVPDAIAALMVLRRVLGR
jgi:DNA polymerase III epsilon subunit-like protein